MHRFNRIQILTILLITMCLIFTSCGSTETADDTKSTVTEEVSSDENSDSDATIENKADVSEEDISTEDTKASQDVEASTESTEEETLAEVEPADTDYVLVTDYIPEIVVDLKYATSDNFTGTVIYDFTDAYLRYGTVKKLKEANDEFVAMGYTIKIWDAYRPFSAQEYMWTVYPDGRYVANPKYGPKAHNLGGTMDITLVTLDGAEVLMPTGFDDFSLLADRDYSDVSEEAAYNARLLEDVMERHGFTGYSGEWWDYSDTTTYEYLDFNP